jgi:hypothetical protein
MRTELMPSALVFESADRHDESNALSEEELETIDA